MSTFRHPPREAKRRPVRAKMKPWQRAVIAVEGLLLLCVLAALAVLLVFNQPGAVPAVEPQAVAQSNTAVSTPTVTSTPVPVPLAEFTPLPTRTPQPTNTRVVSRVQINQGIIDEIERQVIRLRVLSPRATVPAEFITRAQMVDIVRKSYESDQNSVDSQMTLYRALGFVPTGAKVDTAALVTMTASNIAGFYDAQIKRLYVISEHENMNAEEKSTLAHEYAHALQDQQFDLTQFQSRMRRGSTDLRLALSSIVEGDATTVMSLYLYGNTTQSEWEYLAYRASFTDRSSITATNISTRVQEIGYFPYLQGAQFIAELLVDGKGWAQVDHAYADPPQSTSIILHPERYLTSHTTPMPIVLPDLGPALGQGWATGIRSDTLGEFVTSVHLDEFLNDPKRSAQAADGWEGDRFALWQTHDGRLAFAWRIAWSTPRDVGEFFDAYTDLLQKRIGQGATVERENADTRWYSGKAGSGLIRRTGEQTLVLWGPDRTTIERLLATFK